MDRMFRDETGRQFRVGPIPGLVEGGFVLLYSGQFYRDVYQISAQVWCGTRAYPFRGLPAGEEVRFVTTNVGAAWEPRLKKSATGSESTVTNAGMYREEPVTVESSRES